ncbi:MAG: hypothetical protein KDG89_03285 [Geminicoccaceae bacterium]|nr:hypothetical protein [Geminicoccaceae bacterium]
MIPSAEPPDGRGGFHALLGLIDLAVFLVDPELRTRPCNDHAHALLRLEPALLCRNHRLHLRRREDEHRLNGLLERAIGAEAGLRLPLGAPRHAGAGSLRLLVAALEGPAAAVLVDHPRWRRRPDPEALKAWFGFTGREAELAARLAAGLGLAEACEAMAIKETTGRGYLKAAFVKTQTENQAQLAAFIHRVCAGFGLRRFESSPPPRIVRLNKSRAVHDPNEGARTERSARGFVGVGFTGKQGGVGTTKPNR